MSKVKLDDLTPEQRARLIKDHQAQEKKQRIELAKKRKTYEKAKESRIQKAFKQVEKIEQSMVDFKGMLSETMEAQHKELNEFGLITTKSKGGFSIVSKDGQLKITRTRDTDPKWDETAHKGAELVKQFLLSEGAEATKPGIFNLLMGLISKNKEGELEYSKVMLFLQHESEFNDEKWHEGLRLIKEGYSIQFKKFGYQFYKKDKEGKFSPISINFSNL